MYFFPKMALHDLYLINLKKNLQCQRLLFCVFFIGWMKLIGSWNKCKVYAWQSWRQLAFVVDVCTAKSVQRVSLLGDILYAIVYWASTVCYVCPWRRDTVCSSGKGRTDPIESNWSWTRHLIFLLWKIQCYLDGNKGGVWGWGGAFSSICGLASDTKATRCPLCLPVLGFCRFWCSIAFRKTVFMNWNKLNHELI